MQEKSGRRSLKLNHNLYLDHIWKLDFRNASKGFVKEEEIRDNSRLTKWLCKIWC